MDTNWTDLKKELKDDLKEIINLTAVNTDCKLDIISVSIKEIKSDMAEFKLAQKADVCALEKRVEALEKKDGEKVKGFLSVVGKAAANFLIPVIITCIGAGVIVMLLK